jgi:hypothetical protein
MENKTCSIKALFNKEMGFMIGMAVYLSVLVISSRTLRTASKLIPLALCALCFVLIAVKAIHFYIKGDVTEKSNEEPLFQYRSIVFLIWLAVMGLSFRYIGYMATIIVGMLVMLRVFSKSSVLKTVCVTFCTSLFVYVLFGYFLSVRFPKGVLF